MTNEGKGTHAAPRPGISRRSVVALGGVAVVAGGVAAARDVLGGTGAGKAGGSAGEKSGGTGGGSASRGGGSKVATSAAGEKAVARKVSSLTLEQKVAQMFFPQPEALTGMGQVTAAGDTTRKAFASIPVGGMCYFAQNLQSESQARQMLSASNQISLDEVGLPLFMSVDEEGGTVSRVGGNKGFSVENVGNMRDVGDTGDARRAYDVCKKIAGYLVPLGFNLDFAPDADIVNGTSQTMAKRSFGTTADVVAPMVESAVKGFLDGGIMCCAKHFPGIGGAQGDSETEAIATDKTLDQLRQEELVPFKRAIAAGVPMVMVGHVSCPKVTGDSAPASLSRAIVTDVLRDELGFDGIIITDSLGMGAVAGLHKARDLGVAAIQAGVDMLLMTPDLTASYQGVLDAVRAGTITEERIDESVTRIVRAKLAL
ncbi:glycoside hydrolase family 3 protein [Parafannyhessea umbonata]|uniref:beta-N-acetylhexosaminidase n=1 Tax=Parafannyhessea umbonata TaxID=604330 RepID=A0A1G6I9I6_9ACTN|nr:glycoside hydrolase family 3 N-terminal domain-containing protein [Parafannyhessea umbonata]SDC03187.1 beta-N-acetylhexosaminidase [Parafannyhessea umbonata]